MEIDFGESKVIYFLSSYVFLLPFNHDSEVIGWDVHFAEFQLSFLTCFNEKNFTVSLQVESLAVGVTLDAFGEVLETKSFEASVDEFNIIVRVVLTKLDL